MSNFSKGLVVGLIIAFVASIASIAITFSVNRSTITNLEEEITLLQHNLYEARESNEFTTFEYTEVLEDMAINSNWEYAIIVSKVELEGKLYSDKYIIIYGDYDPQLSPYKVEAYD